MDLEERIKLVETKIELIKNIKVSIEKKKDFIVEQLKILDQDILYAETSLNDLKKKIK